MAYLNEQEIEKLLAESNEQYRTVERPFLLSRGWTPVGETADEGGPLIAPRWQKPSGELVNGYKAFDEATSEAFPDYGFRPFTIIEYDKWSWSQDEREPTPWAYYLHEPSGLLHHCFHAEESVHAYNGRPLTDDQLDNHICLNFRRLLRKYDLRHYHQAVIFNYGVTDYASLSTNTPNERQRDADHWCLQLRELIKEPFSEENFEAAKRSHNERICQFCKIERRPESEAGQ